jgi:hypothetical protein
MSLRQYALRAELLSNDRMFGKNMPSHGVACQLPAKMTFFFRSIINSAIAGSPVKPVINMGQGLL